MKKIVSVLFVATIVAFMISCGGNATNPEKTDKKDSVKQTVKTVENLKAALKGETTASAKYEAFAKKADEEKMPQIAVLFRAASKSESIHAANHKKVLVEMNENADVVADSFAVKTTKENLDAAYNGEKYEVEQMYPDFIAQAGTDNIGGASNSFTWAFETEKKHMEYYKAAIDALSAKKIKTLPTSYFVCPKCGFTYNNKNVAESCELCKTPKASFIEVK